MALDSARPALGTAALGLTTLALAACTLASKPPAPTPTPVSPSPIGVEVSTLSVDTAGAQTAGAYWARFAGVWWPDVEPEEGQRNWAALESYERELAAAAALGKQSLLIVRGTPAWAQALPGVACGPIRADKLEAFARFVGDLVARYSAESYGVRYWEFGNEPDIAPNLVPPDSLTGCWGDEADPGYGGATYAGMLREVYPAVKLAEAEAQVLVGGLVLDCNPALTEACPDGRPARFLEGVLQGGGRDYFDGVSYHAYDFYQARIGLVGRYANAGWDSAWNTTGPVLLAKAAHLRGVLDQYDATGKFLMATEIALLCGSGTGEEVEPECQATFEFTKAYYVAQAYAGAVTSGLPATLWYNRAGWRNTVLANADNSPRPAHRALQVAVERLGQAEPLGAIGPEEVGGEAGIAGYAFRRNGRTEWLIWSRDGNIHRLMLPSQPEAVSDVFGAAAPSNLALDVSVAPFYIDWLP